MCVFTILIELFSTWHLLLFWTKPVQLSSTERLLQSWQIQWGYCIKKSKRNLLGKIENQNFKRVFDQGFCSAEDKKHLGLALAFPILGVSQNITEIEDKFCEKYGQIITSLISFCKIFGTLIFFSIFSCKSTNTVACEWV